jgi:hypothetical protein
MATTPTVSKGRRVDAREARAWKKYNAAWQAHADAVAAVQAVSDALGCGIELFERMEAWMARPHDLTPFPWPGGEYVVPCNQDDLNDYLCRPNAYPPGVQEWLARFQAHIAPCLSFHHETNSETCRLLRWDVILHVSLPVSCANLIRACVTEVPEQKLAMRRLDFLARVSSSGRVE